MGAIFSRTSPNWGISFAVFMVIILPVHWQRGQGKSASRREKWGLDIAKPLTYISQYEEADEREAGTHPEVLHRGGGGQRDGQDGGCEQEHRPEAAGGPRPGLPGLPAPRPRQPPVPDDSGG